MLLALSAASLQASNLIATIRDAKGQPVPDAVISLYALGENLPPPPAPADGARHEIVQQDQEYIPYVTVVRVGAQIDFPNKDEIQHHIYSLSKAKRFEKPLYAPGSRESVVFDQPGVVTLGCNIHDWMVAYIVVLQTPYFGKSNPSGTAELSAPAGKYRVEVWHPRLAKPITSEIALSDAGHTAEYSLSLKPDRRIRRTPEAKGSGY